MHYGYMKEMNEAVAGILFTEENSSCAATKEDVQVVGEAQEELDESKSQNIKHGFHGTSETNYGLSKKEASKLFDYAVAKLSKAYKEDEGLIIKYLDSRYGRHLSNDLDRKIKFPSDFDPESSSIPLKDAMKSFDAAYKQSYVKKGIDSIKKELREGKDLKESVDVDEVIKELIDTSWGGSNDSQAKAIQLLKGLAFSDDPKANKFMQALDKATSSMKLEESAGSEDVGNVEESAGDSEGSSN